MRVYECRKCLEEGLLCEITSENGSEDCHPSQCPIGRIPQWRIISGGEK